MCLFQCCTGDLSSNLSGSVFCQVCLQFQVEMLIYLSLRSTAEAVGTGDPVCCQDLHVGGPLQQTDAGRMHSLRAHSNTRWQCKSAALGHLVWVSRQKGFAARGYWIQQFSPPQMDSLRFLHRCRAATWCSERRMKLSCRVDLIWFVLSGP